jgi:hypothetical protein
MLQMVTSWAITECTPKVVSNSHRDINYRPSNENLTVIDVCK